MNDDNGGMSLQEFFNQLKENIQSDIQSIDSDIYDVTVDDYSLMLKLLNTRLSELRAFFLSLKEINLPNEIVFFKEMKPEILSMLFYSRDVQNIILKQPPGSFETQKEYYNKELQKITDYFESNLEFYQYFRGKSTFLDKFYFVRNGCCDQHFIESVHFIHDQQFSTGHDSKVARIIANEMLWIYLNRQIQELDKKTIIQKNRSLLPEINLKWTGSKNAAVELGYGIYAVGVLNNGNANLKEIMTFIETAFGIDLGDYYRAYLGLKDRKKDRTAFFTSIIEQLTRKMDSDDL